MGLFRSEGGVLPDRRFAYLGRLVRATPAALVSCGDRVCHAGSGVGLGLHALSAAALEYSMIFYCDTVASRCNPDGQLLLFELSGSRDGCVVARRSLFGGRHAREVESKAQRWHLPYRNAADTRTENLEAEQQALLASPDVFRQHRYVDVDLLRDDGRTCLDVCPATFTCFADGRTLTVPDRHPL